MDDLVNLVYSYEQEKAIELFEEGYNIFITGAAGTGKSIIVKKIIKVSNNSLIALAPTGIAALSIKGHTLHSYFGIKVGYENIVYNNKQMTDIIKACISMRNKVVDYFLDEVNSVYNILIVEFKKILYNYIFKIVSNNQKKTDIWRKIKRTKKIIIDEISMISGDLFCLLDIVCCIIKKKKEYFGGMQIVACGDFFQLPPVIKNEHKNCIKYTHVFQTPIWSMFEDNTVVLEYIYRQEGCNDFKELLCRLRIGQLTNSDIDILKSRIIHCEKDIPRLLCKKDEVLEYNNKKLNLLKTENISINADFYGNEELLIQLKKQFSDIGLFKLNLKVGARVLLCRNIGDGLVNGSLGIIHSIRDSSIEVIFDNIPIPISIKKEKWELEDVDNKTVAVGIQFPLLISYAITIHKAQGLTLEEACISIDNLFTPHQAYVGLSRVKSLEGLYIQNKYKDINKNIL